MKALKGHIIFTKEKERFEIVKDGCILYEKGRVVGIYKTLPEDAMDCDVIDYGNAIIIPSFVDLHIHGPQYMQIGLGLDLELIDWLDQYTFMLEQRYEDGEYGRKVYPYFVDELYQKGTLRSCIYGTIHQESNKILVDTLQAKGLSAYVGKVNMNWNAPEGLTETLEDSLQDTEEFINYTGSISKVKPIITPRFAPSCTMELLKGLGQLSRNYNVPIQTHLAENQSEVAWVKELFPDSKSYSDVYKKANLYGEQKTLMAHSIYLEEEEIVMAKNPNIYLVHCPNSNMNLASGIMPVTKFIDEGLQIGLGSDVGAGHEIGMNKTISAAIQCSKLRHLQYPNERVLELSEAFYLATKVNGSFFGKTGSFEEGYTMDALVIKDPSPLMTTLTPLEQLQRYIYCGDERSIVARYLEGEFL